MSSNGWGLKSECGDMISKRGRKHKACTAESTSFGDGLNRDQKGREEGKKKKIQEPDGWAS